jgi:hypothetical protein
MGDSGDAVGRRRLKVGVRGSIRVSGILSVTVERSAFVIIVGKDVCIRRRFRV